MALIAALCGLLIAAIGALGMASPPRLVSAVSRFQSQRGLYVAAAIRIAFGTALLLAGADSRAPGFLYVFGLLALVAGIFTPFFGVHRFQALLGWWSGLPSLLLRSWGAVVLGLGSFLVWAVVA